MNDENNAKELVVSLGKLIKDIDIKSLDKEKQKILVRSNKLKNVKETKDVK